MRRDVKTLLATALLGAGAAWGPIVPEAMSHMATFRIDEVEVRGLRFLTEDSIVSQLQLSTESSVWGDTDAWAERVASHPMVRSAQVDRKIPNGLLVRVEERRPIALAPTPTLEPVDVDGRRLPIDPARYRLDLPILASSHTPPEGSQLFPEDVRSLAAEIDRLMNVDAEFVQRVSTLSWDDRGSLVAHMSGPEVLFLFRPGTSESRLREGEAALTDALARAPSNVPAIVDLRFADQVVVRRMREE